MVWTRISKWVRVLNGKVCVTLSHADVGGGELEEEDLGDGTELVREGRDRQRLRSDEQKLDGNF